MQFGLMVFFLPAFPLAALFSLINNVIEIRSDAFKMCLLFQRPFGQRVANIGNTDMEQQNFCFEFKA
jgi:anoctamin-8